MKLFKSALDASLEDTVFTAEVDAMIDILEKTFDEHGAPAVIAATVCAASIAFQNGVSKEEYVEYVRSLVNAYDLGRTEAPPNS